MKAFARQHAGAALIGVAMLMLGLATLPLAPPTDDARFYVPAAVSAGRWLAQIASGDLSALGPHGVRAAFASNAEHPPLAKMIMGASWWLLHHRTGWLSELHAARVPVVLLWALTGAVLFAWTRRYVGTLAATGAAGALTAMPRLFFHARVETLDLPIAALCLLSAAALFECWERPSWRRGALAVLLFALALLTKLNGPFLVLGALLYWLVAAPRDSEPSAERALRLPPVPGVLLGWMLVSPLIAWALWPWLWYDTIPRLQAYLQFHLQHYPILFYFAGRLYHHDVAPWYAPITMLGITTPAPILLLAAAGAWAPVRAALELLARALWRRVPAHGHAELQHNPRVRLGLFVVCSIIAQLAAVSAPQVPKYGGVKLFLPVLPLLAVLFGLGFHRALAGLRGVHGPRTRAAAGAMALVLLLSPGWLGTVLFIHAPLSSYAGWTGGLAGATAAGYERQYYDLAYPAMAEIITRELPHGGTVAFLPNPKEYTPHLARWQREGHVPSQVRVGSPEQSDLLVLTHERRWAQYPELMARHRGRPWVEVFAVGGVPLFTVLGPRP